MFKYINLLSYEIFIYFLGIINIGGKTMGLFSKRDTQYTVTYKAEGQPFLFFEETFYSKKRALEFANRHLETFALNSSGVVTERDSKAYVFCGVVTRAKPVKDVSLSGKVSTEAIEAMQKLLNEVERINKVLAWAVVREV